MPLFARVFIICTLFLSFSQAYASRCDDCVKTKNCPQACRKVKCCGDMGGIRYCDSSAGRFVCNNGFYSSCYCTRHAVMDLEHIQGCCLWQGGVLTIDDAGLVICNNGGVSEMCSLRPSDQSVATW